MSPMRVEKKVYDKNKEDVKRKIHGRADVQLGKKGLTNGFINEVKHRLEKHRIVKIRVLKSFLKTSDLGRTEVAEKVAEKCGGAVVDVRGNTFIMVKKLFKNKK